MEIRKKCENRELRLNVCKRKQGHRDVKKKVAPQIEIETNEEIMNVVSSVN